MQVKKMIPGTDWSRRSGWLTIAGLIALGLVLVLGSTPAHAAQLTASWSDATPDDHTGFKVERKTGTTGAFAQVASTGPTVMSYIDTTLTAGTTYCYRVRAYNTVGDSPYTPEGCAVAPTPVVRTLTVAKSGTGTGTVDSSPGGITCGSTCSATYTSGSTVSLSAAPATGATFTGWSGACTGTGGCAVVLDANKSATATFALSAPTTYALTVTKTGTGSGTVTSSPAGISCGSTCSASYNTGANVTLTAAAATGSTFTGWGGACSGTGSCVASMTAARSVTATFALSTYALTVTKAGAGAGTVTSNPSGINCSTDCTENYNYNTSVTLTAAAATGSTFTGWSGAGCSGTGTCAVSMTAVRSVTATFTLQTYTLTVTPAGNGSGTVTSNPAGINCSTDCTENYTYNTSVTLIAAAATGSSFTGWSGAGCTGTGACTVTMSQAQTATATFATTLPALTTPTPGSTLTGTTATFTWSAGTGVAEYYLQLGTAAGAGNLYSASTGTAQSVTVAGLPGGSVPLYVRLWSRFGTTWQYNDYSLTAMSGAGNSKATLTTPTPGSTLAGTTATFTWSPGSGVAEYYLQVGTVAGGSLLYSASTGTAQSVTVAGLAGGSAPLYVRLWSRFGTTWQYNDYSLTAMSGAGNSKATLTTPTPGSTLAGTTATFTWSPGSGVAEYYLQLWHLAGGLTLYNASTGTAQSVTVAGLPGGSVPLYVRLWSRFGTTWQYNDYSLTARP